MASIKVLLWDKANGEEKFPITIRIIKDRRPSYMYLGHYIEANQWDEEKLRVKKSHPNSTRLNNLILKKLAEANETLIEMETHETDVSSQAVKSNIKPKVGASFFAQAKLYTDNLRKAGSYGRYLTELGRVERFREFLNGRDITFKEITKILLKQYKGYLQARTVKGKPIKERTLVNYLMLIRTVYNQAIDSHVTDNKHYPFGKKGIVIKFPDSIKIGWNADEVKMLEEAELSGYRHHARNLWLVSFYFAGMRLADVMTLRWPSLTDNRLHYAMSKNDKADSLKIPDKALAILEQYKNDERKHDFVFPELKVLDTLDRYEVKRKIAFAGKRLEETLKTIAKDLGIEKNISMHISRHSFAQISGGKIPVQILQKLYRHRYVTTTIGYQSNFTHEDTDKALDSVLMF